MKRNKIIMMENTSEKKTQISQDELFMKLGKKSFVDMERLEQTPRKNRDSLIIMYQMLLTAKDKSYASSGVKYKTLIYYTNLSSGMLKKYLAFLLKYGFMERIEIEPIHKYRYKSR